MSKSEFATLDEVDNNKCEVGDFSDNTCIAATERYYIKHVDNDEKYCLINSWKKSKFLSEIIDNITDDYGSEENPIIVTDTIVKPHTLGFVVEYLNTYAKDDEPAAPSSPLSTIHISEIFKDEYYLFKPLVDKYSEFPENFKYVSDFANASAYLNTEELPKKLCAVLAYLFRESKKKS